ncbi:velvet factor-domain-containing protein [Phycomyces nitens]|nr:velvet factor-domain-containing protein [Phycomyces nitens]
MLEQPISETIDDQAVQSSSCTYRFIPSTLNYLAEQRNYQLIMRQEPQRAKMSVINERDRRPIEPPPILQLNWLNCSTEETKKYLQSPFYFMVANLMKANDTTKALDSHEYLSGSTVSSLYRLRDVDNTDGGFFVFGDLAVKKDGYYRLQFNLFEITDATVHNRKTMLSEVFVVHLPKQFPGAIEATFLSRTFSDQGVKMRIRKEHRLQTRKRKAERLPDNDPAEIKRIDQELIPGQRTCQSDVLFGRWQSNVGMTSRSFGQPATETVHQASSMTTINPFNPGGEGRLRYKDLTSRFRYYPKQNENKHYEDSITNTNTSSSSPNSPSGCISTSSISDHLQDTSEFPSPISRTHSITSDVPERSLPWTPPSSGDIMKIEMLAPHGISSHSGQWPLSNGYQDTPDLFHNPANSPPSPTPTTYTAQSPPAFIHQAPSSEAHLASYHFTGSDRHPPHTPEPTHYLPHTPYATTNSENWGERLPPLRDIIEDYPGHRSTHRPIPALELPAIITPTNPRRPVAADSSFLPTLFPSYVSQSAQHQQHQMRQPRPMSGQDMAGLFAHC